LTGRGRDHSSFVLLVHVPGMIDTPADPLQWTMFFVASTIGGAAWIVARSYATRSAPGIWGDG
jgi:hypothetical protein